MSIKRNKLAERVCAAVVGAAGAVAVPIVLTGCNTFAGMGEDVEATGSAISEVAEDSPD